MPDVHLVSLMHELEGLAVPSKFYGIAAAGRSTVCIGDPNGEIGCILRKESCGVAVQNGDSSVSGDSFEFAFAGFGGGGPNGENARAAFERAFDKELALQSWNTILGVK